MKELFEIFYTTKNVKDSSKKLILCNIGEYMYRDNTVLDHEINFFMCIVSLEDLLK